MPDLNRWWEALPSERYWMEITTRPDLGSDLFAPQVDDAGHAYWSYNLVTEARVGDTVLHWHKNLQGAPAMVGWSVVSGPTEESEIVWQARGTVGRSAPVSGPEPAWLVPLQNYTPLLSPVTQSTLRREEDQLRSIKAELERDHGKPLYFPFAFSERRPVRTAQGYLVKLPAAALDVFPELVSVARPERVRRSPRVRPRRPRRGGRYQNDARVRKAIERHAVARAVEHFESQWFAVEDVGSFRPYDLHVTRGTETRHVEVKGGGVAIDTIELTAGEVENANSDVPTDLFLVSDISWWREPDGSIGTDGGEPRLISDWTPESARLTITRYRYTVPD